MRVLCGIILFAALANLPAGLVRAQSQPPGSVVPSDSPEALLRIPGVKKELRLTGPQTQKIDEVLRSVREKHKEDFEERRGKQADLTRTISQEVLAALGSVLEPAQMRRLEQVRLQRAGLKAFMDPKIEKALGLTDEAKHELKVIRDNAAKEISMLFRASPRSDFEKALKNVEKVRSQAIEKSVAVFTPEQKRIWHELVGEPLQIK